MEIPASADDLTADFLSEVLSTSVSSVEATQIAQGTGFMGEVHRLTLGYQGSVSGPQSLIAKLPTQDPGGRFVAGLMRLYEKESGFYKDLAGHSPVPVPACHYNGGDLATDQWCLLLEDISDARPGDQLSSPTPDESRAMVRQLARIHAGFQDKVNDVGWLEGIDSAGTQAIISMYPDVRDAVMDKYAAVVPQDVFEKCVRFYDMIPEYFEEMRSVPSTLIHGDFRTDNLLFRDDGSFVVLDWQVIGRAPGSYDLYYLMALSLDSDSRLEMQDELIDIYLQTLDAEGGCVPKRADLLDQMRKVGLLLGITGTVGMSQMDPSNARGEELFLTMWKRGVRMFEDLDAGRIL